MEQEYASARVTRHMSQLTRKRYPELESKLKELPIEALHELERFLRDVDYELIQAKRTVHLWPGGPKIKL